MDRLSVTFARLLLIAGSAAAAPGQTLAQPDPGQARNTDPAGAAEVRKSFSEVDQDGNQQVQKEEAEKGGLTKLVSQWSQADRDGNSTLSKGEFAAFAGNMPPGDSTTEGNKSTGKPPKPFSVVDEDSNRKLSKNEVRSAGLLRLLSHWKQADTDHDAFIGAAEYDAFYQKKEVTKKDKPGGASTVVGAGRFKSPETVVWDEREDVYLVSNINGKLTEKDGNGFISRVSPDGRIIDLKWISAEGNPAVVLHAPKGMLLTDAHLVVADLGAVRFFDRSNGDPLYATAVEGSYMLNDLALDPNGSTIYVTDTGGETEHPGAVYRLDKTGKPQVVAKGERLDRPNGIITYEKDLLITPFGKHTKEVYRLSPDGKRSGFAQMPNPQLDGLLHLSDGSFLVTSWGGRQVLRLHKGKVEVLAGDIPSPAQIGYDQKRQRVLVPVLRENNIRVYPTTPMR